jgi:hypothetical protein
MCAMLLDGSGTETNNDQIIDCYQRFMFRRYRGVNLLEVWTDGNTKVFFSFVARTLFTVIHHYPIFSPDVQVRLVHKAGCQWNPGYKRLSFTVTST